MKFAIAIETGTDDTAFGVVVPDLPGCFSAGDTVEEAFDNAREAIEAYVEVLAEDGKPIPETRPLSALQQDKRYRGWTWGIVDVPIEKLFGPAEKINITVPSLLLKRIDAYVTSSGKTRSGFLAEAAVIVMREPAVCGGYVLNERAISSRAAKDPVTSGTPRKTVPPAVRGLRKIAT